MKVKIDARFATVEDTAKALGVPLGRARKLARLVIPSRYRNGSVTVDSKVSQTHDWTSLTAASLERKNSYTAPPKIRPAETKDTGKNRCLKKEAYACQSLESLALMFS